MVHCVVSMASNTPTLGLCARDSSVRRAALEAQQANQIARRDELKARLRQKICEVVQSMPMTSVDEGRIVTRSIWHGKLGKHPFYLLVSLRDAAWIEAVSVYPGKRAMRMEGHVDQVRGSVLCIVAPAS